MSVSNAASTADADITEHLFTNRSRDRVTCARPIHRQRQLCSAAVRAEYRLRSRDLAITFSSRIAWRHVMKRSRDRAFTPLSRPYVLLYKQNLCFCACFRYIALQSAHQCFAPVSVSQCGEAMWWLMCRTHHRQVTDSILSCYNTFL